MKLMAIKVILVDKVKTMKFQIPTNNSRTSDNRTFRYTDNNRIREVER